MRSKLAAEQQMTIEEFLAFTETRPQEERWELIEGQPIMNPSPTNWHQLIATNIVGVLRQLKLERSASWTPLLGIGTRVPLSANSLPQPDVQVLEHPVSGQPSSITGDGLILFEVLSRSNTRTDQAWRRRVYASVPNCQHYVTVAQAVIGVTRFDRASGWKGVLLDRLDQTLELPALGSAIAIPLTEIYRWTPLAGELHARVPT